MFTLSTGLLSRTPQPKTLVALESLSAESTSLESTHFASSPRELDLAALVGASDWARLPLAVQRRFAATHADTCYVGQMDLRCSAIGHVYAALVRWLGGPLTHLQAQALPTTVRVAGNGKGGVVWERCFHGAGHAQDHTVRSTKELDAQGRLLERTDGGLSMSLDVTVENGALVFRSRRFWWVLGALRLPVPAWLAPGVCCVMHTDLGSGLFRFTLSMDHPLWGQTFHQTGVFADPVFSSVTSFNESTL